MKIKVAWLGLGWALFATSCGRLDRAPETERAFRGVAGQWSPSASGLAVARGLFTTELRGIGLADGRVLVPGGVGAGTSARAEVDIFASGAFGAGSQLTLARSMGGLIALADGGALFAGGGLKTGVTTTSQSAADRFNPSSNTWTSIGSLSTPRFSPAATRLADGRVLIAGGQNGATFLSSAELFDPANNSFTPTAGSMQNARVGAVAALLPDGRVLFAGGTAGGTFPRVIEFFDPASRTFSNGPNMAATARIGHAGARLPDGSILYCGACTANCTGPSLGTCEIYDPTMNTAAFTGALNQGSVAHSMVTLPTGRVLLTGGTSSDAALSRAELYDPGTGTWTLVGTMASARYDAAIALLLDGRVLVAGGRQGGVASSTYLSSAELYDPGVPTVCQVSQIDGTTVTLANGIPCDDGDPCTAGDACEGGACRGADVCTPDAGPSDAGAADTGASDAATVDAAAADATVDGGFVEDAGTSPDAGDADALAPADGGAVSVDASTDALPSDAEPAGDAEGQLDGPELGVSDASSDAGAVDVDGGSLDALGADAAFGDGASGDGGVPADAESGDVLPADAAIEDAEPDDATGADAPGPPLVDASSEDSGRDALPRDGAPGADAASRDGSPAAGDAAAGDAGVVGDDLEGGCACGTEGARSSSSAPPASLLLGLSLALASRTRRRLLPHDRRPSRRDFPVTPVPDGMRVT